MSSKATEIAKNLPALEHPDGSPIRALVVDDEEMLKELVSMALKMIGWEVQSAGDGPSALNIARDWRPDVLVLDIMMPGFDGLELLNRIRKFYPEVPCLFLTAKDSVDNRIEGLAAGADDYVTKPFRLAELLARVRALLRRQVAEPAEGELRAQDIRMDVAAHRAFVGDVELSLTAKEFDLLRVLLREAGSVVARDALMREVWGSDPTGSTKTLDMHVSWLRRKLGDDATDPHYITTVRGMGFRFESAR